MADTGAPTLPEHVKKPNEEEYKKELEKVNADIERVQKQFVSLFIFFWGGVSSSSSSSSSYKYILGRCQRKD